MYQAACFFAWRELYGVETAVVAFAVTDRANVVCSVAHFRREELPEEQDEQLEQS